MSGCFRSLLLLWIHVSLFCTGEMTTAKGKEGIKRREMDTRIRLVPAVPRPRTWWDIGFDQHSVLCEVLRSICFALEDGFGRICTTLVCCSGCVDYLGRASGRAYAPGQSCGSEWCSEAWSPQLTARILPQCGITPAGTTYVHAGRSCDIVGKVLVRMKMHPRRGLCDLRWESVERRGRYKG